jgi:hypothetical protein
MRAAAIFQLSWPSDRIGTIRKATKVPITVATVKWKNEVAKNHRKLEHKKDRKKMKIYRA